MLKALLFGLLPPFVSVPLRRLLGARIGRNAGIGWLSIVAVDELNMGDGARIGSLAVVRARRLSMAARAAIRPLALLSTHTIQLGEQAHVAPTAIVLGSMAQAKSRLVIGDHSRIFPLCWLEPGEGIEIGCHVGIGGHGLIFTHGSWTDYLRGGPVAFGPVKIEDGVWLPWRITVLAGVTIGEDSIVMSGSVVTRSLPSRTIAGGSPAKVLRAREAAAPDSAERLRRAEEIVAVFHAEHPKVLATIGIDDSATLRSGDIFLALAESPDADERNALLGRGIHVIDHPVLTLYRSDRGAPADEFMAILDRYGVRLYRR